MPLPPCRRGSTPMREPFIPPPFPARAASFILRRVTDATSALTDAAPLARTPGERLLARLVDVRPGEARLMFLSCASFFFLLASYFILRPIRDAMGVAAG